MMPPEKYPPTEENREDLEPGTGSSRKHVRSLRNLKLVSSSAQVSSRSFERPARRLSQTDDRRRNSNPDPSTKRTRPKRPAPMPAEQSGARLPPRD
ncbi:hypothetical protein CDAR_197101 [Caerostris darwini]|uniref:Uncharacterized protein n=1 Tax=Caerostris darwini TaxID=1538125 RepID=A0AAV4UJW8_9ARAC|nr:hypothetical protein CDAR_197101 [Caerostris darwini]